jgi:hypothetical protein
MLAYQMGKIFHIIKLTYLLVSNIRLCNYRTLMCDQLFRQTATCYAPFGPRSCIYRSKYNRWCYMLQRCIDEEMICYWMMALDIQLCNLSDKAVSKGPYLLRGYVISACALSCVSAYFTFAHLNISSRKIANIIHLHIN